MLRLVIFGAQGQLGSEFLTQASGRQWDVVLAPRDLRLEDSEAVRAFVRQCEPQWVINAAAMTDVDAAHMDPDRALRVNGLAPGVLARTAREVGARVIHISSEAVYDGSSEVPYAEGDACQPVSVYGVSKLTGDLLTLTYSPESYVLRTSWVIRPPPPWLRRRLVRSFMTCPTRAYITCARWDLRPSSTGQWR